MPERQSAVGMTLPAAFEAIAGNRSKLVFAQSPLSDTNPSATRQIVVTLRVASGAIYAKAAAGVTVGGTAAARTFTGTLDDLNLYFTDPRGFVTYRAPRGSAAAQTLTAVASKPNGPRSRPSTATISVTPRSEALFRVFGQAE